MPPAQNLVHFVCLLRAVNVGGKVLLMKDLARLCEDAGFENPKTFIQSGNVVLGSKLDEAKSKAKLEKAIGVPVLLRTAAELKKTLANNPFKDQPPNRVIVLFMDAPPKKVDFAIPGQEQVVIKGREVFVYYPEGQGVSKLRLPYAKDGTGRNVNTVTKLLALVVAHQTAAH